MTSNPQTSNVRSESDIEIDIIRKITPQQWWDFSNSQAYSPPEKLSIYPKKNMNSELFTFLIRLIL